MLQRLIACLLASLCCFAALPSSLTECRTQLRRLLNKVDYSVNEKSIVLTLADSEPGLQMAADEIRRGACISPEAGMRMLTALEEACRRENLTSDDEYRLILADCIDHCFNTFDDRAFAYRTALSVNIGQYVSDPMQRYLWMSYANLLYPDFLVMGWQYCSVAVNSDMYARHMIGYMGDIKVDSDMKFHLVHNFLSKARNQNYQCDFLPRLSSQLKDYARKTFGETGIYQQLVIDELVDNAVLAKNPASSLAQLEAMRGQSAGDHIQHLYLLESLFGAYMTLGMPDKAKECNEEGLRVARQLLSETPADIATVDDPCGGINYIYALARLNSQELAMCLLALQDGRPKDFDDIWTNMLQESHAVGTPRADNMVRFMLLDGLISCSSWYEDFDSKYGDDIMEVLTDTEDEGGVQTQSPYCILIKYNALLGQYRSGSIGNEQQTEQLVGDMMSELTASAQALGDRYSTRVDLDIKKNMADAMLTATESVAMHWGIVAAQERSVQLDSFLIANKFRHHQLGLYSTLARAAHGRDSTVCRRNIEAYRNVRQQMRTPEFAFKSDWDLAHIFAVFIQDDDAYIAELERLINIAIKQQDRHRVVTLCSKLGLFYGNTIARRSDAVEKGGHYLRLGWQAAVSGQLVDEMLDIADPMLSYLSATGDYSQYHKIYNDVTYMVERYHWEQDPRYLSLLASILYQASDRGNVELATQVMGNLSILVWQMINNGNYDRTLMHRLVRIEPAMVHFATAWINTGVSPDQINLNWIDETVQCIKDVLGLADADVQDLYYEYGHLQLALGNTDRAAAIADTLYYSNTNFKGDARDYPLNLRLSIAQHRGDFNEASRLLTMRLGDYEKAISNGLNISDVSAIYWQLAEVQLRNANYNEAMKLLARRYDLVRDYIMSSYAALNESERVALTESGVATGQDIYRLLPYVNDRKWRQLAYDATLTFKNILLTSTNMARRAVYSSGDSALIAKYEQSRQLRKVIWGMTGSQDQMDDIAKYFKDLRQLEDEIEVGCPALANIKLKQSAGWRDVQRALGRRDVAVEYIMHYDHSDSLMHYSALVLRKGDKAPAFVPLATRPEIERLLSVAANASKQETGVNRTYRYNQTGRELYSKVWAPIDSLIGDAENVYFAPTAQLSYLAFAAIEDSTRTPLCQRYRLHQLSSTAEVCQLKSKSKSKKKGADVPTYGLIGGIRYDADQAKADDRLRNWAYLPNSRTEIDFIDSLYCANFSVDPKRLRELEATEAEVRALSGNSPRILQLSTHGFYSSASQASHQPFFVNKGLTNDSVPNFGIPPLKRGGIILADANTVWNNESQRDDETDGVLTSEELSSLDLSNTNLTVLSACETGLGEFSATEGINGLQRGLKLAGVKSIIMTLWRVNDRASNEFMQLLHTHIIVDRQEARLAFHNTQREMQAKYPNSPYLWAPFVMLD